jgi:predicted DNA-binding transcriptional regulator YafY
VSGRNAIARRLAKLLVYLPTTTEVEMEDLRRLARWLGCSDRTIRRDIAALKAAGFRLPKVGRMAA